MIDAALAAVHRDHPDRRTFRLPHALADVAETDPGRLWIEGRRLHGSVRAAWESIIREAGLRPADPESEPAPGDVWLTRDSGVIVSGFAVPGRQSPLCCLVGPSCEILVRTGIGVCTVERGQMDPHGRWRLAG